jgi:hypothetical protein
MRRNRGRRGLDILKRLQKDPSVTVENTDADHSKEIISHPPGTNSGSDPLLVQLDWFDVRPFLPFRDNLLMSA